MTTKVMTTSKLGKKVVNIWLHLKFFDSPGCVGLAPALVVTNCFLLPAI